MRKWVVVLVAIAMVLGSTLCAEARSIAEALARGRQVGSAGRPNKIGVADVKVEKPAAGKPNMIGVADVKVEKPAADRPNKIGVAAVRIGKPAVAKQKIMGGNSGAIKQSRPIGSTLRNQLKGK